MLTLAGGLASTIFAPITASLAGRLEWRGVFLVLSGVLAVVTIPAHGIGLRRPWPPVAAAQSVPDRGSTMQRPTRVSVSGSFLALGAAFALTACVSYAVVVNLVPLLASRGYGLGVAAGILGLGGVGQVAGRLAHPGLHRLLSVRARTVAITAGVAVCTAGVAVLTARSGRSLPCWRPVRCGGC